MARSVHLTVPSPGDLDAWRSVARRALLDGFEPHQITWSDEVGASGDLLATAAFTPQPPAPARGSARVPAAFLDLAASVLCHRSPARLALLYRLLWRLNHEQPQLLAIASDPDVRQLQDMAKSVSRDSHKMKAFVRFREFAAADGEPAFVAWFEPDHRIVRRVAPFFARRFTAMRWSILTPDDCAHWSGSALDFSPGMRKPPDQADALEDLWRTYYAHIFNPARLNVPMMQKEMPQKYWKHLPEAQLIPALVQAAMARTGDMIQQKASTPRKRITAPAAAATLVDSNDLQSLAHRIDTCRACPLWQPATRAVPGSGPADAQVMLVGEQPGDQEDLAGEPFVGPAGTLLDKLLAEVGMDRRTLFLTNAVKHFKFEQRGKRRLHQRANASEQAACRPWLNREIELLRPKLIVCLGVTAAQAVLGRAFTSISAQRATLLPLDDRTHALVTVHPSALLRMPREDFDAAWTQWVQDWRVVADGFAV